ncbi:MAG: AMP-binding protein, partial [Planctomycetales bacterium]|nr:AMP-binding protein [Planctomycetales bacterium]
MQTFRCYVIGADSLLIECCERLMQQGHQLAGVITSAERIAKWARQRELPVLPDDDQLATRLSGEPFDYLFAITHLSILPPEVLALPRRMTINFHDGPLPRYAGLYAPAWALLHGEREYGVTWHQVVEGLDEGAILKQRLFSIAPGETSLSLNTRCFEAGMETFSELLDELANDRVRPVAQDLSNRSYFSRAQRPAAACVLDLQRPAEELEALVRALDFGRYENPLGAAKLIHNGDAVIVTRATARDDARYGAPGTVLAVHDNEVLLATSRQVLAIQEVTTLDGSPLSLTEWLHRWSLTDGDLLHGLTAEQAGRLTQLNERLAKSEPAWVKRLSQLTPVELPYVRAANETIHREWQSLKLPTVNATVDEWLTAIACYFGKLTQQTAFDVAYESYDEAHEQLTSVDELSPLVSKLAVLHVELDPQASFTAVSDSLRAQRARILKRGTWLRDVVSRFPALRDQASLHDGKLLPVAIQIDPQNDSTPPTGALLSVVIDSSPGDCYLHYANDSISAADAACIAQQIAWVREQIASAQLSSWRELQLLTPSERQRVLVDWNQNPMAEGLASCIHEQFAEQARRTPDQVAVTFDNQSLTYAQLDSQAGRLAVHLQSLGVGPDVRVGIHMQRSLEMVAAVLGVLKAGGSYVPLDPSFPVDRLSYMAGDAGIRVLLADTNRLTDLQVPGAQAFDPRQVLNDSTIATGDLRNDVRPEHLAYVIYTSGSTGQPKGVMVEHRNVTRFFAGMDDRVPHDPPGTWLAVTTLSFDISVLELLWTLCRGFHVVLFLDRQRGNKTLSVSTPKFTPQFADRPIEFSLYYWGNDDAT